jgi:CheY-like chemotaxis protein/two-component sensor histidine kinase
MERQMSHLVRLVDDLLEVSRITRGLIEIEHEPVDLGVVVHAAIDTSQSAIESAGHELIVDVPIEPVLVEGDAVRLTQVVSNLLTNAAKYTNAKGRIEIRLQRDGQRATISVRDNGIGIAPHQLNAVFDMFTQVDRSSRRAQGGLGIGLTLVRSLVTMHGGRVEARSPGLDQGSEFVVEFPTVTTKVHDVAPDDWPAAFPARRILIVDDNRDAAETLGELLTKLGTTCHVVGGGRAALDVLSEFRPDAILLDIGMPEMDGYQVARRIRALPEFADVLLIALTGWSQEPDQQRSAAAGFDHHVVKPPDIGRLRDLLSSRPPMVSDQPTSPRVHY